MKPACIVFFLFAVISGQNVSADWIVEAFTGSALSFDTDLTLQDATGNESKVNADYETRPFEDAPYYAWRISHRGAVNGWALEFVHHKIYLKNVNSQVLEFEISHGYNLLMFNYVRALGSFWLHAGAGVVIGYPHATIGEFETLGGYQLTGPAAQIALGRQFFLGERFFISVEGKFTLARAKIDLNAYEATAPNVALHGLIGIGFKL